MNETLERIAAVHIKVAREAMTRAADALADVGSPQAKQRAKEMRGAAKIAKTWESAMLKEHEAKQKESRRG